MNMMTRKAELVPDAGGLQSEVGRLKEILAPAGLDRGEIEAAIEAGRAAEKATRDAKSELEVLRRQHPAPANGFGEAREVQAAAAKVARCEDRQRETRASLRRAREKRDEVFLAAVMPQIEQAAPILLEVAKLLNDAVNPLRNLYAATAGSELPMPRLLASAPVMSEAVRIFVATLNAATAPNPVSGDED